MADKQVTKQATPQHAPMHNGPMPMTQQDMEKVHPQGGKMGQNMPGKRGSRS
jgi:hypothetical protein